MAITEEKIKEHVAEVIQWFKKAPEEEQRVFLDTPKDKLVRFHFSLGMNIRNKFELWKNEWEPELRNNVDYSPNHPDAICMRIINEVWDTLKKEESDASSDSAVS